MKKKLIVWVALTTVLVSCKSHYEVTNVSRTRILIDNRWDRDADSEANTFIAPFKQKVDSVMSPVVGHAAKDLEAFRPESPLSNLLADVLMWTSSRHNEQPVFSVLNMGGIRASIGKGKVTRGDILDVAPFENKICFLTLSGSKVIELFEQMAMTGGEAVSHGVELVFSPDHKLRSALLNGEAIDPARDYRIVTIDYLAEGNDKMTAFKAKQKVNAPQGEQFNLRNVILDYLAEKEKQGLAVDADIEGRVKQEN